MLIINGYPVDAVNSQLTRMVNCNGQRHFLLNQGTLAEIVDTDQGTDSLLYTTTATTEGLV